MENSMRVANKLKLEISYPEISLWEYIHIPIYMDWNTMLTKMNILPFVKTWVKLKDTTK
jgi:hypothetical protein